MLIFQCVETVIFILYGKMNRSSSSKHHVMTYEGLSALGNQELLPSFYGDCAHTFILVFSYLVIVQVSGAIVKHEVSQIDG